MREIVAPPVALIRSGELSQMKEWLSASLLENRYLALEIGCGVGLHPVQWANANPEGRLVAFERTLEKYEKFKRRLNNHSNLENILALHADAAMVLSHLESVEIFDEIYVLYPNPYPKGRHKNLRMAYSPFTQLLRRLIKPTGKLIVATNIEFYVHEIAETLPKDFEFHNPQISILSSAAEPRSHFEKKYLARNEQCWNLVFKPKVKPGTVFDHIGSTQV